MDDQTLIKEVADALETPWVVHWNTEHAARGKPFGGRCCLEMVAQVAVKTIGDSNA